MRQNGMKFVLNEMVELKNLLNFTAKFLKGF